MNDPKKSAEAVKKIEEGFKIRSKVTRREYRRSKTRRKLGWVFLISKSNLNRIKSISIKRRSKNLSARFDPWIVSNDTSFPTYQARLHPTPSPTPAQTPPPAHPPRPRSHPPAPQPPPRPIHLHRLPRRIDQPRHLRPIRNPHPHLGLQLCKPVALRPHLDDKLRADRRKALPALPLVSAFHRCQLTQAHPGGANRAVGQRKSSIRTKRPATSHPPGPTQPDDKFSSEFVRSAPRPTRRHHDKLSIRIALHTQRLIRRAELHQLFIRHRTFEPQPYRLVDLWQSDIHSNSLLCSISHSLKSASRTKRCL